MFGWFSSIKWIAAAALAGFIATVCAAGWFHEWWVGDSRLNAAVAARDAEWSGKLAAATARAELLAATQDIKALQAAQLMRFQLTTERKSRRERTAVLEQALAAAVPVPEADPIVFPRAIAKGLRR